MLGRDRAHGLNLKNDPCEAHEVGRLGLPKRLTLIGKRQRLLLLKWDRAPPKLDRQALLIDRL